MSKALPEFTRFFTLHPLKGAGPILFGDPREAVIEKMEKGGYPQSGDKGTALLFFRNAVLVEFDESGAMFIEARAHEDLAVIFQDRNLFDLPAVEVSKLFSETQGGRPPLELSGSSLYEGSILTLQGAGTQYDYWGGRKRKVWGTIGCGSPAYFEAVAGRPRQAIEIAEGVKRYHHAKFGIGAFVSQTGSGPDAILELRFGDGVLRKLKASFVKED